MKSLDGGGGRKGGGKEGGERGRVPVNRYQYEVITREGGGREKDTLESEAGGATRARA